jgi:glutamyl-tRNA reductase
MSNLHLMMLGFHQRTTPLAIRERLAFSAIARSEALQQLGEYVSESLILSTCNRTEVYVILPDRADPGSIIQFLSDHSGLSAGTIETHLCVLEGPAVARHVCRLAAGLDSMVLGEDQIVGQLKEAIAIAQHEHTLGQGLHRLLQQALAAGKAVRTQTGIARSHLSVVSVALDVARQSLGTLHGKHILLIGAGQTAGLALKHLRNETGVQITIANRTLEHAEALASRYAAHAIALSELPATLATADLVLSCTSAPEPVVNVAMMQRAIVARKTPVLLLDLAVPHDIDPAVGAIAGVQLVDVDDLQSICADNYAARVAEIAHAEELIDEAVSKFIEWWNNRLATPTIRALREHAEAIRCTEVERTLARMPQLSSNEQAAIHALSEAIINKLLHHPVTMLKGEAANPGLLGATQRLFQIEVE